MLRYISVVVLALSMAACGGDQESPSPEEGQADQQAQQQMQPTQSAPDIEVSDEELKKFAEVSIAAQQVQAESQQEMIAVLEEEDFDVQTYNIIAESRYNDQPDDSLNVSQEDLEKFDVVSEKIETLQIESDENMSEAIEAKGMEMDRFMEINMAVQQDQELLQRLQQMMQQQIQSQDQGMD